MNYKEYRNLSLELHLFFDRIMKEHAEFIRGLLDPSEKTLIETADKYATEYEVSMNKYKNNSLYLTGVSLS